MAVNYIEEYRKSRGLSIEELADRTGLPAALLPQMIQGNRYISLKNREKIAAALECRVEDLFSTRSAKDYVEIATRGIEVTIGIDPDLFVVR